MKKKKLQVFSVLLTGAILSIAMLATDASSAEAKAPQRGGVLKIDTTGDPPVLNPMVTFSDYVFAYASPVFNGLVMIDPTQEEVSVEKVVPSLAERWTISPDGKIYTFYLRKGVRFHDGRPFTAKDAKYSLEFFAGPKGAGRARVGMMDRVEIVDDYTIKVSLKYPHRPFLLYLSFPYCVMLPAHLVDVDPKKEEFLIGTGPFKFQKRIPGKVWIYERNPEYFLKGLPYLDGVEVYSMSWDTAVDAFCGGRLSMAGGFRYGLEFKTTLEKVKKYVPEAVIKLKPISVLRGILFNVAGQKGRKGPWQDVRVRRAMIMVTDFPGSIMAMPGSLDLGISSGIVPSYMPTGLPWAEVEKILGIDKPMDQRIQEAKKLIKEAGYPDGFKAELITRAAAKSYVRGSEFMMESWRKNLNIQLDLKPLENAVFFPRRDAGDFDVMYEGMPPGYGGAPEETLSMFVSVASENYGRWSNQAYDRLFSDLLQETDPKKGREISVKMQRIFLEELPCMFNITPIVGTAYRPTMHGFVMQTGHTGWACMDRVWMEK